MDAKMKTVLAVVVGIVIGATLLGGAIALPAAFHALAVRTGPAESGYGMMGERFGATDGPGMMGPRSGSVDGRGMMGPRGGQGQYAPQDSTGVCPNGGPGVATPQGGRGQYGPRNGTGIYPNGGTCPNVPTAPATES